MGTHVPNRHGKGTLDGGRFAPDQRPAATDTRTLTLDTDPVADLYDKMIYDEDGFDSDGYDRDGFNRWGLQRNGTYYGEDGYNQRGFDTDGLHRNGTIWDEDGYDDGGYDDGGYDDDGFRRRRVAPQPNPLRRRRIRL